VEVLRLLLQLLVPVLPLLLEVQLLLLRKKRRKKRRRKRSQMKIWVSVYLIRVFYGIDYGWCMKLAFSASKSQQLRSIQKASEDIPKVQL